MPRNLPEQRRDAAGRKTAAGEGAQRRSPVPANVQDTEPKGQAQQQQRTGRNRPFAPGEDGESH